MRVGTRAANPTTNRWRAVGVTVHLSTSRIRCVLWKRSQNWHYEHFYNQNQFPIRRYCKPIPGKLASLFEWVPRPQNAEVTRALARSGTRTNRPIHVHCKWKVNVTAILLHYFRLYWAGYRYTIAILHGPHHRGDFRRKFLIGWLQLWLWIEIVKGK